MNMLGLVLESMRTHQVFIFKNLRNLSIMSNSYTLVKKWKKWGQYSYALSMKVMQKHAKMDIYWRNMLLCHLIKLHEKYEYKSHDIHI